MTGLSVVDTINAIEAGLPVADWSVDGLRVWPIVRYQLGVELATRWRLPAGQEPNVAGHDRSWARVRRLLRECAASVRARVLDPHNHQSVGRPYDALFLQTFRRPLRVDGRWLCPFAEPLRRHLAAHDLDLLVLELGGRTYPIPRYAPSGSVPFRDRVANRSLHRRRLRPEQVQLPGYSSLGAFVASWPGARVPDRAALLDLVGSVRVWSEYFRRVIARTRIRIGFVPCFFGPIPFAFILACREAGIPTVDLQHGVQGREHVAFGSWAAVPPDGYELLPSYFWCWSRADVAAIESWSSGLSTHVPLHGGNPWINVWKHLRGRCDEASGLNDVATERDRVHILYTFAPEPWLPDSVLEVVRASPPTWVWWLRLHPSRLPGSEQKLRTQLGELGHVRVEIERATKAPLLELLRFANVHVTAYSTVVLEAAAFGIPSIVTHSIAERYYKDAIAAGRATVAMEADAIQAAIERLAERTGSVVGDPLHLSEEAEADVVRDLLVDAGVLDALPSPPA